jgi:hypothetical protein
MNEQQRRYREDEERRQGRGNDEREDRYPYGGDRHVMPSDARFQSLARAIRADEEWGTRARQWDQRDEERHPWDGERDRNIGYGGVSPGHARRFDQSGAEWGQGRRDSGRVNPNWGSGGRDFGTARGSWGERGFDSGGSSWAGSPRGESYAGRGPKDYRRSDERIREEVSDRLTDDDRVDASEISIQVQDGTVTLTGTAGDREQKRRAEDIAESISGVQDVINNIRVERLTIGKRGGTGNVLGIDEAEEGQTKVSKTKTPTSVPS